MSSRNYEHLSHEMSERIRYDREHGTRPNFAADGAKALYDQDTKMEMRKSHLNPVIKEVYDNYFKGGYGCHAAHHALHTSYVGRKKFNF